MKTKIKRHSRSVISVLLAVCMLISCMTAAMIATDAAKAESESTGAKADSEEAVGAAVDSEAVGADYYLYYRTDNTKSLSGMKAVKMSASGSTYTASFTTSNQNFALAFGTSSSPTSSLVRSTWTVNKSGAVDWAHVEDSSGVYFVCGWAISGTSVTVTFNGSSTVTLSTGSGGGGTSCSTDKTYRVVGTANIAGSAWANTATANNMTYSSSLGCYVKTYTNVGGSGVTMDFRIIEGSTWSTTWGFNQANKVDQSSIVTTWQVKPTTSGDNGDNNIRMVTSQKANVEIRFDDSKSGTAMITVIVTPSVSTVTAAVTPASSGTATVNGAASASNIAYGGTVTLAATPAANYHFGNWTSSTTNISFASSTTASTTATVRGTGTVTATFVPDSFTVTKASETGYTITKPTTGTAAYTSTVTVSATAASDYYIDGLYYKEQGSDTVHTIYGSSVHTTNTSISDKTFTMPAKNVTVYAWVHEKESNNIVYGVCSGQSSYGYVSVGKQHSSSSTQIDYTIDSNTKVLEGTKVNFGARPAAGYKFVGWYSDAAGTMAISGMTTQDKTVTSPSGNYYAKFELATDPAYSNTKYRLLFKKSDYENTEYNVHYWNKDGTASSYPGVKVKSLSTYTNGEGTVYYYLESSSAFNYLMNLNGDAHKTDDLTVTQGTTLVGYSGGTTVSNSNYTAKTGGATTTYYPVKMYIDNPDKGVAANTYLDNYFCARSSSVDVYAKPSDTANMKTSIRKVSGSSDTTSVIKWSTAKTSITMNASATSATATVTFIDKVYYKLTYSAGQGGTVTATSGGATIQSGSTVQEDKSVTITATPASGYVVSGWTASGSLSGTSTNAARTFTITANTDARVYFSKSKGTSNTGTYIGYRENYNDPAGWYFTSTYIWNGRVYGYFDTPNANNYHFQAYEANPSSDAEKYTKQKYRNNDDTWANTQFTGDITNIERKNYYAESGTCYYISFNTSSKVKGVMIDLGPNDNGNARPDLDSNTYHIIPIYNTDISKVTVYAKDGSYRGNSAYDYFPGIADTVISSTTGVTNISSQTEFETAVATKGSKVTVTTTIDSNHRNLLYVRGFSVNGTTPELYDYNSNGVYTLEYTIPADFDYDYLEITPIYYYVYTADKADDFIQFYIENFDKALEATGWGNTLSVYPYHQNSSGGYVATKHNAFGGYPGQPVIYYGGRRFIEIPTHYYTFAIDNNNVQTECFIKGITLSNDYYDIVHRDFCREVDDHFQTYDYDDFYKIAKETGDGKEVNHSGSDGRDKVADQITFAFKYRTAKNNFSDSSQSKTDYAKCTNGTSYSGKTVKAPDSSFAVSVKDSRFPNGWEPLLDYHDRPIDLFGKQLTTAQQSEEPLLVVSDDYAINYVGRYATTWTVYNKNGSNYEKIAEIAPSALIVTSAARLADGSPYPAVSDQNDYPNQPKLSSYATAYRDLLAYAGKPVQITYESAIRNDSSYEKNWTIGSNSSEVSKRSDGRWFYSYEGEAINANLRIEYKDADDSDDEYVVDTFRAGTNKGTVTGASVKFTNTTKSTGGIYALNGYVDTEDYNEDYPNNPILSNQNDYFNFEATAGSGYIFAGWYFERDGIVTNVNEDLTKLTGSSQMTSNATFVARYIKNPSGHLTVNHTVAESSIGSATTYVAVKAVNRTTGAETWLTGTAAGTAVVSGADNPNAYVEDTCDISDATYTSYNSGYTFVVVLKTVTDDFTNFDHFSAAEGVGDHSANYFTTTNQSTSGNTTTNYFEVDSNDLFELDSNSFPKQTFDTLTYYSHLTGKTYNYNFNFTYPAYNPDYGTQGYRVTGTFVYDDLAKNMRMNGANLEFKDDTTKTAFLNKIAPYEDNFMTTISWKTTVATSFASNTISATIPAVYDPTKKVNLSFKFNYSVNASTYQPVENATYYSDLPTVDVASADLPIQMNTFQKGGLYVTAPEALTDSSTGKVYVFRYWSVKTDPDAKHSSVEYTRCFATQFNYVLFQNSIVESVYTEKANEADHYDPRAQQNADEVGVTISFIENSRNQYNDGQKGGITNSNRSTQGDRMYSEFLLSFNSAAKDATTGEIRTLKDIDPDTMRWGLIIEAVGDIDLVDGKYTTKTEAEYRAMYGETIYEIGEKLSGKDNKVDQQQRLENFITGDSESFPITGAKSEQDVTRLDNKNRIQWYYSLANRSHSDFSVLNNRYKVFRAYSYIADVTPKAEGGYTYSKIQISDKPVYFTIYDMASIQNYAES